MVFGFILGYDGAAGKFESLHDEAALVLEICEAELPRNQQCELTARIVE